MTYYSDYLKYKRLYEHLLFVLTQREAEIAKLKRGTKCN